MTAEKVLGPSQGNDTKFDLTIQKKSNMTIGVNNPVSDFLFLTPSGDNIANQKIHTTIVDVNGKIILKDSRNFTGNTEFIDTSNIPQGVYYLHITADGFTSVNTLVKVN
jgi:hypothetical protein